MPDFFNEKLVVTGTELVPAFYKSRNSLEVTVSRSEKRGYGLKRIQRGGGANKVLLIDFDSLPKNIQEAIGDPRSDKHILERYYTTDKDAVDFYTNFVFGDGSYIQDAYVEQYVTNASMLKALIALKIDREREIFSKGSVPKRIISTLLSDAMSFNTVLQKKWNVQHDLPESEKRFKETFNDFAKNGYIMLISKRHKNQNAKKMNDQIVQLLNNIFAGQKHKPTYAEVAGQYEGFLNGYVEVAKNNDGEMYDPKEFRKIGSGIIKNYLAKWENKIGNEAKRSGDRQKLKAKFTAYHDLDKPKYAGSIISIDDRQPPFEYAKGNRVWFYNGIDLGSECFTTWVYGKTKEGIIIDFYRQMVRNYAEWGLNLPAELECESSLNSSFKETFLKEGNMFENVRIEANNARGKRIEQYYRPLRYNIEKKEEGWIARPFALSESNQMGGEKVPLIPYNEIVEKGLRAIETWNNMPHSVDTSKTRWEYFLEKQHPNLKPTNYRAILPYLGHKTTSSCNAGIILLDNGKCLLGDHGEIYTGERLINLMKRVEGKTIDIYWLDGNDGKILKALIYIGDQYICEALPKPSYQKAKIEQTPDDLAKREVMSKYAATIEGYMTRKRNELEPVTVIDNRPMTLNNKFQIPGLKRVVENNEPVEVIEEVEESELMGNETSFKTALKDRF